MAIPSEDQAESLLLNSFPVELHWRAAAVHLECTTRANCVRTNENPVLPCGEATEDSRLERLCWSKAQIRLEPSQSIRRLCGTRLDGLANLVFPVQIIRRGRHQFSVKGLASRKCPREAGSWLDNCIDRPRCDVDAGERPPDHAQCFVDEPVVVVVENEIIYRKNGFGVSARFENPES